MGVGSGQASCAENGQKTKATWLERFSPTIPNYQKYKKNIFFHNNSIFQLLKNPNSCPVGKKWKIIFLASFCFLTSTVELQGWATVFLKNFNIFLFVDFHNFCNFWVNTELDDPIHYPNKLPKSQISHSPISR